MIINNPYTYSFSHNYIHVDSVYFGPLASPFERVKKPTLTEIVDNGKQMMMRAVECVITKHERELKVINNRIKLESKSALASIARTGNCHGDMHSYRMAALMRSGHEQYLDSLVGGFAPRELPTNGSVTHYSGLCDQGYYKQANACSPSALCGDGAYIRQGQI
jgi:hypothetical protein